jgi:iron complex transport system substrate-binding protein
VAADPEVILLGDAAYGVTPDIVAQRPGGWAAMTAVETGAVRPVDDIIITRPGPRLGEGLAALAEAIHPGLDLGAPRPPSSPGASLPAASPSPT